MERMIIYGLVLLNLCIGLLLYYHRPRPFGRGTYSMAADETKARGTGPQGAQGEE